MPYIVLDIETLSHPAESFMIPAGATAEETAKLADKSGLDPLLGGTVCCVGLWRSGSVPLAWLAETGDERGEEGLLRKLQAALEKYPDAVIVTWNGAAFDLPFLRKRAARHGLFGLARRLWLDKPWSAKHCDLRLAWTGGDKSGNGRLKQVAEYLGADVRDSVDGGKVSKLWRSGQREEVRSHCLSDVRLTRYLLEVFDACGWVSLPDVDGEADGVTLDFRAPRELPELVQVAAEAGIELERRKSAALAAGLGWSEEDGCAVLQDGISLDKIDAYLDALRT